MLIYFDVDKFKLISIVETEIYILLYIFMYTFKNNENINISLHKSILCVTMLRLSEFGVIFMRETYIK